MSSASTNLGTTLVSQDSDYWELTNFGTNTIDLTGYQWNDNAGGLAAADPSPFIGLKIGPGESIVFFQNNAPSSSNTFQFHEWWGSGLGANVQLVMYIGNGLGSGGDGVRVWGPGATNDADVVDTVDFGIARRGSSFTYNRVTGFLDTYSTNGVDGAFKAERTDDIGSPGINAGPVPLVVTQQPTNISVNPGDNATFSVAAYGLPRARYQWYFGTTPIAGATASTLTVQNVQVGKVGSYHATLDNGLQTLDSSNAVLSLNAAPEPPMFTQAPQNQNVFIGQSPTFTATASGVPQPTYQWQFNGTNIGGATGNSYSIASAALTDAGVYTVIASNSQGNATNSATLAVTRRPNLVITEVMSSESTNGTFKGHNDWWELSNFDDFTVDLHGYRYDDNSATLAAAVTFTNYFSIAPGESIVFVENMTPDEFRAWWGPWNIGTNVQVISYVGAGLSLSSLGDAVVLWNSGARDDFDTIASEEFSTATDGVSFGYDPNTQTFGDLSVEGLNGAWRAPENGDIGSPGFIRNPRNPRVISMTRTFSGYSLKFTTDPGVNYHLEMTSDLTSPQWMIVGPLGQSTGPFLTLEAPATAGNGFLRVVREQ